MIAWIHCNQCLRSTRHELILTRELCEREDVSCDEDEMPSFSINWKTTYSVLECRGCGGVTLQRRLVSVDTDTDETTYYPPRVSRQTPRWIYELPKEFSDLLKESYVALHAGSKRLAIMGARSLVDLFMTKMVGDVGGFQQKMNILTEKGLLSVHNRSVLEAALGAGHAVSHRGHLPKDHHVNLVFDIVENLIQTMILVSQAEVLKSETPGRKSNKTAEGIRR